ncbi:MAG: helix-turn-helix transcriptional regulator [Lachnospiraceae bacterium]|nr:helix-turn-helix transcriptional regulator [Lachnospiraceae bacterium]
MDYKSLGKRIREERLKQKLTQAQLAKDINVSDTYIGAIERGERCVPLDTLVCIVNRLGVTVDFLLTDSVPENDSNVSVQLQQLLNDQPLERKQLALHILHTLFSDLDECEKRP